MQPEANLQQKPAIVPERGISYWQSVRQQLAKNRIAVWSRRFICLMLVLALLADFISNERPLACKYRGELFFPVFHQYAEGLNLAVTPEAFRNTEWDKPDYDWVIFPPVPYLPGNLDHANEHGVSPFSKQNVSSWHRHHWLGTDELGRDILAGMIHGTRTAMSMGIVSMAFAAFIGIFFGALAGFFGDDRLKVSAVRLVMNFISAVAGVFYGFGIRSFELHDALAVSLSSFLLHLLPCLLIIATFLLAGNFIAGLLERSPSLRRKVSVPLDMLISRFIEIMVCIPTLFLIISVAAIVSRPSEFMVMIIIGLTGWTGIARYLRAELFRIRSLEYMEAAKALGYSEWRMLLRHAVPNAISPVLIALAFGIASAILNESLLSYLGIGMPAESITWGSMLAQAQQSPGAWWLALFPGFAIFITVTVYNLIGETLTDAMDPRLKK